MGSCDLLLFFDFFFFLFFLLLCLGGCCEAFVGDSDGSIKSGIGGLDGGGEVGRECSVIPNVCELLNLDHQRFNPRINESWS